MTRKEFLSNFLKKTDGVIIASLGKTSKELAELNPTQETHYVKGAMGSAIGVGLGYAVNTYKHVYVIIGDGATLMHLGQIATVEAFDLTNLHIIILNNERHESCGGQNTNFFKIKKLIPAGNFKIYEIHPE